VAPPSSGSSGSHSGIAGAVVPPAAAYPYPLTDGRAAAAASAKADPLDELDDECTFEVKNTPLEAPPPFSAHALCFVLNTLSLCNHPRSICPLNAILAVFFACSQPRLATRDRRGSSGYGTQATSNGPHARSNNRDASPKKGHSPPRRQSSAPVAWNSKAASQRATSPKKNDNKRLSGGGGSGGGGNGGGSGGQERGRQGLGRASREGRAGKEADFDLADALSHIVGQVSTD
jgi:hypothetical protein